MARNKTDYDRRFRRNRTPQTKRKRSLGLTTSIALPRVVGEPSPFPLRYPKSRIRRFADKNRSKMTTAETRLRTILTTVNGGALWGRFTCQHVISGNWIVDFYIPEVRLAIEVDGRSHFERDRAMKDRQKEADCKRFDITLVRVQNRDVFGDTEALLDKLRAGWRRALMRKNAVIGKT